MNKKAHTLVLVCIIVLMLIILIVSAGFRYAGAKVLPMIVAGAVLLLSIMEIVRSNREGNDAAADEVPADGEKKEGYLRTCLLIGGWLVGFLVAITIAGFPIAMLVFIVSYLKWRGRRWLPTIVMAVAVTIIIYGLFNYLLGVELYRGLLMDNV